MTTIKPFLAFAMLTLFAAGLLTDDRADKMAFGMILVVVGFAIMAVPA